MDDTTTTAVELAPIDQQQVTFLPGEHETGRVWRLANSIAKTDFVPKALRGKPEAIMAAMLTGREIGIGAMHSLRAIDVIEGRPSLSPELMASLILRHPSGHELYPEESSRTRCVMAGRRADWPSDRTVKVEWTLTDARMAGLVGDDCTPEDGTHHEREVTKRGRDGSTYTKVECGCRQGWRTYPRAMLRARATAELARAIFPDVVERVSYIAEELGGQPQPHDQAMDTVRDVAPDQADSIAATYTDDDVTDVCVHCGEVIAGEHDCTPDPPATAEVPPDGDDHPGDGGAGAPTKEEPPGTSGQAPSETPPDDHDQLLAAVQHDWRQATRDAGASPIDVLKELIAVWPHNDQAARPNKLTDVDLLVASNPAWAAKTVEIIRTSDGRL